MHQQCINNCNAMTDQSPIVDFYQNQTIFLTGATGFLGKVLIEKLLRTCPDLRKIYILVRPKKGKTTIERCNDIFKLPCFENLAKTRPEFRNKVHLITGDCEQPHLALKSADRDLLINETTVLIHAAATVKFDQTLRIASYNNVRAVCDVLALAKQMPRLAAFVHVSTAYCHCPRSEIDECFYDIPMTSKQLLALLEIMDDATLNAVTPRILGKWPNTYVFTKAIAEDHIRAEGRGLPIAIVRPGIVTTSMVEPMPGWIDNFYGPVGIVVGASLGVLRSLHAKLDSPALIVPCDYVANIVLASGWKTAMENNPNMTIYNFIGSNSNLITWRIFMKNIEDTAWDYPTDKVIWYYCFNLRENYFWHKTCIFFLHTVPAYLVDFIFICLGKPPIAVSNYRRLDTLLSLTSYFSTRTWKFTCENLTGLWHRMSDVDKRLFAFNMDRLDWKTYATNSVIGGRLYLLKDPLMTIPQGHRKIWILRIAHYSLLTILAYLLYLLMRLIFRGLF